MMLIVVPPKRIDLSLRVLERREPMHVQTFFAESSVEGFDGRVVRRFTPTTEVEDHAVGVRPQVHRRTDELGAVVAIDPLRQTALKAQPLEGGDDITTTEALADVDGPALAREEVEHGQRTEPPPISQLVRDEVHAPDVILRGRWSSLLTVDGRRVAPRALPAER